MQGTHSNTISYSKFLGIPGDGSPKGRVAPLGRGRVQRSRAGTDPSWDTNPTFKPSLYGAKYVNKIHLVKVLATRIIPIFVRICVLICKTNKISTL